MILRPIYATKILFEEGIIDDLEGDVDHLFESIEVRDQIAKTLWHLSLYISDKTEDTFNENISHI